VTEADLTHQLLKSFTIRRRGARMRQVTVDHLHSLKRSTQPDRPLLKGILALGAFRVLQHLM
jgi:hypothetical protein